MSYKIFFLAIVFAFPQVLLGQAEYYSKDSIKKVGGFKLIDCGPALNAKQCLVKIEQNTVAYTPEEVIEYQFKNGRFYKSFAVKSDEQKKYYFLERIVNGKLILYYLKAEGGIIKFFICENDSNLSEIPKNKNEHTGYFNNLASDCPNAILNIQNIKLKKSYLKKYIEEYNNCTVNPFPRVRYYLSSGIALTYFSAVSDGELNRMPDGNDFSFFISASADIPVNANGFSIRTEIYYKQGNARMTYNFDNISNEILINYASLSFPLLYRYTIIKNTLSPFFEVGPLYSRNIKNEGALYEYESVNDNIFINIYDSNIVQSDLGGFSVGTGITLKYGSKYSWIVEANYSKLYSLKNENALVNLSELRIGIGLLF